MKLFDMVQLDANRKTINDYRNRLFLLPQKSNNSMKKDEISKNEEMNYISIRHIQRNITQIFSMFKNTYSDIQLVPMKPNVRKIVIDEKMENLLLNF